MRIFWIEVQQFYLIFKLISAKTNIIPAKTILGSLSVISSTKTWWSYRLGRFTLFLTATRSLLHVSSSSKEQHLNFLKKYHCLTTKNNTSHSQKVYLNFSKCLNLEKNLKKIQFTIPILSFFFHRHFFRNRNLFLLVKKSLFIKFLFHI